MSVLHPAAKHPKEVLYDEVYDPLVRAWFQDLNASEQLVILLREAPDHDLVENLERFNTLFHDLVENGSVDTTATSAEVARTLGENREHMLWEDQMTPGPEATTEELMASFRHKIKRNISLAAIEAIICLESAIRYAREVLGLTGAELAATLRRSTMLPASLAALHDEREKVRMQYLTGTSEEIMYPAVNYADVVSGRFRIDDDKFMTIGLPGQQKIRFRKPPPDNLVLDSPTMMCPAQRLNNEHDVPLNNEFWDLLIDIYQASGRFT
jgi:hypothetical protein